MKYRNKKIVVYTRQERMAQVVKVLAIIAFSTLLPALGAFLMVLFGLFVRGLEIDFEHQKDIFLGPAIIFGVGGFVNGCINSGVALLFLYRVLVAINRICLDIEGCLISMAHILAQFFHRR